MKQYYPQLTGFRFVAAIMVYFSHVNPFINHGYAGLYFSELQAGVGLFFVLSGFLISSRYFSHVEFSRSWLWRFFVNRFARIYPVYFILTTITLVYATVAKGRFFDWLEYALNITFLKGYSACYHSSGIMQGWSLTVEETFYALSPLLLLLLKNRLKISTLALFYVVFTAIALLMVCMHGSSVCLFYPFEDGMIYTFFGRSLDFLFGVFLAMVLLGKFSLPQKIGSMHMRYTWSGALLMALSIGLVAAVREDGNMMSGLRDWRGLLANNVLLPASVMLFLHGLITENTWVRTLLSNKVIEALGKSSYVFYLIHVGLFRNLMKDLTTFEPLLLLLTLALAHLIYLAIEHPLNDLIRKKLIRT
ncbi:MAG: acyltransferase family protein [Flavobacteriales bacterium]